jgi:hypothetical protein
MNRSGQLLNAPIEAMGSDGTHGIGGPYEPRISPDESRFAYYFYVQPSTDDLEHRFGLRDAATRRASPPTTGTTTRPSPATAPSSR